MQNKFSLAATCVLLAFVSWQTASAATSTVRPYKFGFTIEEQQHRQEQRDERGIVMGEFGFITADGIYHVTVYATDEEGKFRIISMKNYPYAGPVAATSPVPALTTTTRTPPPQSISNAACSGCLLPKPPHKTEIRPLSLPLPPAPAPAVAAAAPPPQARPAGAAPTPPPGIFPGAVPARAEQPGRLVPEVYLSQTEKLVQFTMRQLATPPTPAPTTTPAPRVPRPTPPGFPIPSQPVLQLPINHPASLPLITPLRITAQSPFPPIAPALPLGVVGAGDRGLNVALPFQQSIAQSQVDAALAASQQVNTYTSTHTQTQTLPHGVSSSSFASSFSSSYPSRGAANGGKQGTLKPLNTQVDPSSALDSTQLGTVQPTTFDVSKLERIPPATSGPKDLQSHAFGTRPQGVAQGTAQSGLDRIPAGTISRGHVFGNPMTDAVVAQSNPDRIPADDQGQSYSNPYVKDSTAAHSSPVGIAAAALATPVHQGVIFGTTPQDFAAAEALLDSLALGTAPAAFAGAVAQGNAFSSPVKGSAAAPGQQSNVYGTSTAGATAAPSTLAGTAAQQGNFYGLPVKGAAAASSTLAEISTGAPGQQGQQGSAFGATPNRQGSFSGTSSPGSSAAQSALNSPALGGIPATFGETPAQQGFLSGTSGQGLAADQALGQILTGTTPTQQGSLSGISSQGAAPTQSALPSLSAGATPAQQSSVFGATQAAPQGSAAAQQTPANANQANLQGNPNGVILTRPTPERPFLIDATPSPLRVPYPVPSLSQSAERLNDKAVNGLQQLVLPLTQTIPKVMEKFLHEATPVPARLHQSGSPAISVSPFHETVGTSPPNAAVAAHSTVASPHTAAASLHTAASSPHYTTGVANNPQSTQQTVANKLQNIALPVTQHIGDLLVQNTHNTPVQHSTAHSHTPSAPTLSAQPGRTPFAAVGNAAGAQQQPRPQPAGAAKTPTSANSPNLAGTGTQAGQAQFGKPQLASAGTFETGKAGKGAAGLGAASGAGASGAGAGATGSAAGQRGTGAAGAGAGSTSGETGDLYHFNYLLDFNGHEETGSRNGNKQGNYFAIGEDAVARTIEYIANEFGFQPHISWRKLDQSELSALPKENALKHYEFKWFNKPGE